MQKVIRSRAYLDPDFSGYVDCASIYIFSVFALNPLIKCRDVGGGIGRVGAGGGIGRVGAGLVLRK